TFKMGEWNPDETVTVGENCTTWCTAYFWLVPAKVAGTWRLSPGELKLTQTFQELSGTLNTGSTNMNISNAKMRGDEITFTAGGAQYTGKVTGNTMEGTVTSNGRSSSWKAAR